jgi:hypothetical protein
VGSTVRVTASPRQIVAGVGLISRSSGCPNAFNEMKNMNRAKTDLLTVAISILKTILADRVRECFRPVTHRGVNNYYLQNQELIDAKSKLLNLFDDRHFQVLKAAKPELQIAILKLKYNKKNEPRF